MTRLCTAFAAALLFPAAAVAAPARPAPPLPPPSGTVVNVSSESQLRAAASNLTSNTTIILAPGIYVLQDTVYINGTFSNVGVRGASGNADDVVLKGPGMTNPAVPFGIWVGGNVAGVTIANLTIRDIYYHPIILNAGTQAPLVHNVTLINAGQQFLKSNPNPAGGGVDNGIVQYSVIQYDTTSRDSYTNGVDVHTGRSWTIRHNLFRNIRAPQGQLAGPAILMWNGASGTIVEGNTFVDCQREIAFGLIERTPDDHSGGVIRNNFIYRQASVAGDAAINVFDSPNTQVLHNSILGSGTYSSLIEYRFPNSTGVQIVNNLLDGRILARDGATGAVSGNVTSATPALFVNPSAGDLHLVAGAASAIDRVAALTNAATDWDGQPRPLGAAADVGADEYAPTAPPSTPGNFRIVR